MITITVSFTVLNIFNVRTSNFDSKVPRNRQETNISDTFAFLVLIFLHLLLDRHFCLS